MKIIMTEKEVQKMNEYTREVLVFCGQDEEDIQEFFETLNYEDHSTEEVKIENIEFGGLSIETSEDVFLNGMDLYIYIIKELVDIDISAEDIEECFNVAKDAIVAHIATKKLKQKIDTFIQNVQRKIEVFVENTMNA